MIKLSANQGTPVDILSSEFSDVAEIEDEYEGVGILVSSDYSCKIGSDTKEEYCDKKYSENGITKNRDVKTRTVTNWSPFGEKNSSEALVVTANRLSESTKTCIIPPSPQL